MIKAPFNFVPVSERVFFPDWAEQISHDIPFSDGESGVIDLTITAESPVFVRNGHTKADSEAGNDACKSFSKVDNRYFIPATTIKGAIRSVLEIMSFGKMRLDKNAMFAQREWGNPALYTIKSPNEQANLHCGYLKRESKGNGYVVEDCGKPFRIAMSRIDEETKTQILAKTFQQTPGAAKLTDEQKTAKYKYNLLRDYPNLFKINTFEEDPQYACEYKKNRVRFSANGDIKGRLVLTGSPDRYKFPRPQNLDRQAGKFYEFVFPANREDTIPFSSEEWEHFKFIYKDSEEWARIKRLIEKDDEGVPVFFRKNGRNIRDLGMAFLYKLPYEHSPFDTLKDAHKMDGSKDRTGRKRPLKADLADCLFGFIDDSDSMKGRVQISHAFSDAKVVPVAERIVTLGSPKASYYPLYIKQNTAANGTVVQYATYNAEGQISGWKRYMIRDSVWGVKNDGYDAKLDSILLPLNDGVKFTFKIRYHNLRKAELGALLSAVTFHNTPECRYQIGQGKPYGFGKIRIETVNFDSKLLDNYLYEFEKVMEKHSQNWANSQQITQLFTMAGKSVPATRSDDFTYLKMNNIPARNEFLKAKGGQRGNLPKYGLRSYSTLINSSVRPASLYSARIQEEYNGLVAEARSLNEQGDYYAAEAKLEYAGKLLPLGAEAETLLTEIKKSIAAKEKKDADDKAADVQRAKDAAKIAEGLSFLEEKYPDGNKYKVTDFKGAKKRIDQWLQKAGRTDLPQEQFETLKTAINRLRLTSPRNEAKDWANFNSRIWTAIKKYTGEETANQWFNN